MSVDFKLIGSRIQQKRKAAGLTQENLAEKLFVTVGYISQIERGITKVNLETISEICNIINCDMEYIISGTSASGNEYLSNEIYEKWLSLDNKQKIIVIDLINSLLKNR